MLCVNMLLQSHLLVARVFTHVTLELCLLLLAFICPILDLLILIFVFVSFDILIHLVGVDQLVHLCKHLFKSSHFFFNFRYLLLYHPFHIICFILKF